MRRHLRVFVFLLCLITFLYSCRPKPVAVSDIKLSSTSLLMIEGETLPVVATVLPANADNKTVYWATDNPSVATVSGGTVTAVKAGNAVITATTEDGGRTATCRIEVQSPYIAVKTLSFEKTEIELGIGDEFGLQVIVLPENATNKDVIWSSSNPSVATVDQDGKVKGNKAGEASITVTTANGVIEGTCRVYVVSIALDRSTLLTHVGGSKNLKASVRPSSVEAKGVIWGSSDASIATVDRNGRVTGLREGTATISATTQNGRWTASCLLTVKPIPANAVDMGLSVLWATCNLGADTPEGYGDYFAWGAVETWYEDGYAQSETPVWKPGRSSGYCTANCPFLEGRKYVKYVLSEVFWGGVGPLDCKDVLDPEDDAADARLNGEWRIPRDEEWSELRNADNCIWTWTTLNGINGYRVTSRKTGNGIFLPAAGYRSDTFISFVGHTGFYWSSTLLNEVNSSPYYAWTVYMADRGNSARYLGLSVRPVLE